MQELVSFSADGLLVIIVIIGAVSVGVNLRSGFWHKVPVLVMAALTSLLVGKILSLLYQPAVARPFIEMGVSPGAAYIDNPGFPSDHALLAVVIVVAVYAVTRSFKLTCILLAITIVMSVARVMALVHTPLDIVGGVVAGISGAFWYRKLTK